MEGQALGNIFGNLSVPIVRHVNFMIQRRSFTLHLCSHFREFELTAEGQERMKMSCSYKDD